MPNIDACRATPIHGLRPARPDRPSGSNGGSIRENAAAAHRPLVFHATGQWCERRGPSLATGTFYGEASAGAASLATAGALVTGWGSAYGTP